MLHLTQVFRLKERLWGGGEVSHNYCTGTAHRFHENQPKPFHVAMARDDGRADKDIGSRMEFGKHGVRHASNETNSVLPGDYSNLPILMPSRISLVQGPSK